jgi:hypothetical protein
LADVPAVVLAVLQFSINQYWPSDNVVLKPTGITIFPERMFMALEMMDDTADVAMLAAPELLVPVTPYDPVV